MIDIKKLFAKTDPTVSLYEHCISTGEAAGLLWDMWVIDQTIIKRENLCLIAALHDIGKCHPFFQRIGANVVPYADELLANGYLPTNEKKDYRHEIGGEKILLNNKNSFNSRNIAKAVSKIIRLHHQKSECESTQPFPKGDEWQEIQKVFINELEEYFKTKISDIHFEVSDAICSMLWGVIILADWLVSGGFYNKIAQLFKRKVIESKTTKQLFNIAQLRPLQEACETIANSFNSNNFPQAIILEAPMGEGKTEAALFLATQLIEKANKKGFYIALPTMATARSMEERVSRLLQDNHIESAILVSSDSWLNNEVKTDSEVDKSWFTPTKRSLLSGYAVGTVDQAMMSVLRIKQGILRLLGLSSKVLIIDELHAYDSYMQTIIFRLLEWCEVLDIPVIILSATLPSERRKRLLETYRFTNANLSDAYPLITSIYNDRVVETPVNGTYIQKEMSWESIEFTGFKDIAKKALHAINNGGCACVIMNTVRDAQEVYLACKECSDNDTELMLFHSRLLSKDRKQIEGKCIDLFGKNNEKNKRPNKALLIATQVVEQSLDVDFDYMISALAPIDLLFQRSGRIHRHERKRPSNLEKPMITIIYGNQSDNISGIYDEWIISQTKKIILQKSSVKIPEDIRMLIEAVYSAVPDFTDSKFEDWIKQQSKEEILKGTASAVVFPSPSDDWFFPLESGDFFDETDNSLLNPDSATRIGDGSIKLAVLPQELWNEVLLKDPDIHTAKGIMEYCVPLRVPKGAVLLMEGLIECGGYLKGIKAVLSEGEFVLKFSINKKIIQKNYKINSEYGLMEEK